ncbi:AMP-binding protein [Polaribacter undariae]|uniref:AMP-binding protein n=1 Tax=Polaribacter sejongensis TaxID=985043 RepID=A0AAJ1QVX7_9FLAO|nr:AMP-binding protein [Polaribacter undariae]MDN3619037.1 AMP-binding protein [Polaribacter undariae]UWD33123.1 AMP-binding protein [Polaribacter undariae]
MKIDKFHSSFQLNGVSFASVDEILTYASRFTDEIYPFLETWFSDDAFITVKTSGSTGVPKNIKLHKSQMINSALATGSFFDLKENTTALLCLPTGYIAGKMMLVRALTLGWHLDIVAPTSYPLRGIKKQYDFSAMVPLQLENSINSLHQVKKLIVGGGVVSNQLKDKIQSASCSIFATYGMTETITHIAVKRLNNFSSLQKNNSNESSQKDFYQTLPNVEIYKDVRNCLVIKAPKVSNEVIFTNDIIHLVADDQFEWLGRLDNVINSGGVKLHPEKIEEKLSKIISNRFFVAGLADDRLGQKLVLIIELPFASLEAEVALKLKIKQLKSLTKFEIPKEIYFVANFIDTETNKIQRTKTLELLQ